MATTTNLERYSNELFYLEKTTLNFNTFPKHKQREQNTKAYKI